jgi:hypothetical protein
MIIIAPNHPNHPLLNFLAAPTQFLIILVNPSILIVIPIALVAKLDPILPQVSSEWLGINVV